ncbi:MAG TPA: sigma-70 family RNA polymerase sigma factor [Lapillicoccus sp.]|jgi:RNA polymerase sigma factor (sigma-70 family)
MSQPDGHTDLATLLRAASEGDQEAWNAITDRFTSLLWSVARSYRLGSDDAEDVVQNTWLRLLENLTRIDNPEALPGWLATTARREALGILRRRGRTVLTRDEDLGVDLADPASTELDSALLEDERDVELWASFAKLPERCQQLLRVLMACDRPVYAEVSAAFDMPIGSIGPTRMRCLERLRKLVAESGYQFDGPMDRPREARS